MVGWWEEGSRGDLRMLPFVFARDEGRFIPRRDAFLQPPDAPQHDVRWRSNCIACHATGGRPAIDEPRTVVAELGIACEACHGPGRDHAERMRDPLARWRPPTDLAIVNPAQLAPERASAVCGACHAYAYPRDEEAFWKDGYTSFRPGDALEPSRMLLTPEILASGRVSLDTDPRNLFWPDGTVRVGGREHNAMVLSACYLRGDGEHKITCMSCHSMHRSDPDDQLRRDRSVDGACGSCHAMAQDHSRHTNVACVSCHMPKTSYALRYAIRSHRIDSPEPGSGRPNACNLCHLDRSEAWTASELTTLWGARADHGALSEEPASIVGLLRADAAERVVWADAFGDHDALAASGNDWEGSILQRATRDPYAVIRFIAQRSLAVFPPPSRTLVTPARLDDLAAHRDDRPVSIAE